MGMWVSRRWVRRFAPFSQCSEEGMCIRGSRHALASWFINSHGSNKVSSWLLVACATLQKSLYFKEVQTRGIYFGKIIFAYALSCSTPLIPFWFVIFLTIHVQGMSGSSELIFETWDSSRAYYFWRTLRSTIGKEYNMKTIMLGGTKRVNAPQNQWPIRDPNFLSQDCGLGCMHCDDFWFERLRWFYAPHVAYQIRSIFIGWNKPPSPRMILSSRRDVSQRAPDARGCRIARPDCPHHRAYITEPFRTTYGSADEGWWAGVS